MSENMSSDITLQQDDGPVELTELFIQKKKTVTFSDTLTVQAVLCLIAAIAFVVTNIFNSDSAYEIYVIYTEKFSSDSSIWGSLGILTDHLKSILLS